MAKVAFIKLFTGLDLPIAQLSGELKRAGHESKCFYFKEYEFVDIDEQDDFETTDYAGYATIAGGRRVNINCYKSITENEENLLIEEIKAFNPDTIAFSIYSGIIRIAADVTAVLKRHFDAPVIWGGYGVVLQPELCIPHADLICTNEGEEVIVELADKLQSRADLTGIDGTWARAADGRITKNPMRPNLNLDKTAMPFWNIENIVHIENDTVTRGAYPTNLETSYIMMTTRGCPFSCSFCAESKYQDLFGKKGSLRRKSVDLVIEELKVAKETLPIDHVRFYDAVFTVFPRWLKEFLPRYKEEIGLPFWCWSYPTTHNPDLLQLLKESGCTAVTLGVQTGSERILRDHYNRPTPIERVIESGQEIVDAGIYGEFDLIFRHPFETEQDLEDTFEFLLDFPKEMRSFWFAEMTNFPTFGFSEAAEKKAQENIIATGNAIQIDDKTYDYYLRLFRLTLRKQMSREALLKVAANPEYREDPTQLDRDYFSKRTPGVVMLNELKQEEQGPINPSISF